MRTLAAIWFGLILLVSPVFASDESAFRLYLAPEGVEGNDPLNGLSPTQGIPPLTGGSRRLYVWGQVLGNEPSQQYISVGYNAVGTGDVTIDASSTWNYTNTFTRWAVTNAGQVSGGNLMNVRLAAQPGVTFGVRNENFANFDLQYDPATQSTVLGWIDVSGTQGGVYLQIGDITIIRTGATYDDIYLGFGDEGDGLKGDMVDAQSSWPEAGVPEPAAWLLLGFGALTLRRR